jgi:hypothetical protein
MAGGKEALDQNPERLKDCAATSATGTIRQTRAIIEPTKICHSADGFRL